MVVDGGGLELEFDVFVDSPSLSMIDYSYARSCRRRVKPGGAYFLKGIRMYARNLILLLCVMTFSAGCVTPYQPKGRIGGYSDTQLAPDVFRVTFQGNGYTSEDRADDFALLRAAELTLQNGFKYFAVIEGSSSPDVTTWTTPGSGHTSGSVQIYGGPDSYTGTYSGHTTYTPPQTTFISRPRSELLIRCLADKPEEFYAFDASFLQESIKQKYKIE
jgi:hypothetical protein